MRAKLPIDPYIINLSLDFLKDRQQRMMHNTFKGSWRTVNRVLKCDVVKMKFLKLWDLSGYSERTMPKRPICQK